MTDDELEAEYLVEKLAGRLPIPMTHITSSTGLPVYLWSEDACQFPQSASWTKETFEEWKARKEPQQ